MLFPCRSGGLPGSRNNRARKPRLSRPRKYTRKGPRKIPVYTRKIRLPCNDGRLNFLYPSTLAWLGEPMALAKGVSSLEETFVKIRLALPVTLYVPLLLFCLAGHVLRRPSPSPGSRSGPDSSPRTRPCSRDGWASRSRRPRRSRRTCARTRPFTAATDYIHPFTVPRRPR